MFINMMIDGKQRPLNFHDYYCDNLLIEKLRKDKDKIIKLIIIITLFVGSFIQLNLDLDKENWLKSNMIILALMLFVFITTLKSVNKNKIITKFVLEKYETNPNGIFSIQDYDGDFNKNFNNNFLSTLKVDLNWFESKNEIKINRWCD